jgi:uncharacterized damage-inducible protein DinB
MTTNPYAADLGERYAVDVIRETPQRLVELVEQLGRDGLERSLAPGKWSARFILSHLADCEMAFGFRLRQAFAEEGHVIQPFDQAKWSAPYEHFSARQALEVFESLRGWNVAFVQSLGEADFKRRVTHPERGEMTLQTIVETMAGHDRHHLEQLESIAGG